MKKFITILLITLLLLITLPSAGLLAVGPDVTVIAKNAGSKTQLEVSPVAGKLFNLTDMVPGDEETAFLSIDNRSSRTLKIYLRAERRTETPPPEIVPTALLSYQIQEEQPDLLAQLRLRVLNNETSLYPEAGSESELDSYAGFVDEFAKENVLLGTFRQGQSSTLAVTVYLPGETGNEYMNLNSDVEWILVAEGTGGGGGGGGGDYTVQEEPPEEIIIPEEPDVVTPQEPDEVITVPVINDPKMPGTGVGSPVPYYAVGSAAVITGFILTGKKKKE